MSHFEWSLPAGLLAHRHATANAMAEALAHQVSDALQRAVDERGQATLVVSGGRSPIAFFEALAACDLPWQQVLVSLADERWVAPDQPGSNEALVRQHLLRGPAAAARFIALYQAADSLERAAELADAACAELQPIDVLVLGMGDDGHTASLFPHCPLLETALQEDCPRRVLPMHAPVEPHERLSLTRPILVSARLPLLAIQGPSKLDTLRAALEPGKVGDMPVRAFLHAPLQIHWCQ